MRIEPINPGKVIHFHSDVSGVKPRACLSGLVHGGRLTNPKLSWFSISGKLVVVRTNRMSLEAIKAI